MISKYFFPKSVGERQVRAPHLQASSSSCTPSVRWDFYFNASHKKISLNKLMVAFIWLKFGWNSQRNNAQTQKFPVPQGQPALNIKQFPQLHIAAVPCPCSSSRPCLQWKTLCWGSCLCLQTRDCTQRDLPRHVCNLIVLSWHDGKEIRVFLIT